MKMENRYDNFGIPCALLAHHGLHPEGGMLMTLAPGMAVLTNAELSETEKAAVRENLLQMASALGWDEDGVRIPRDLLAEAGIDPDDYELECSEGTITVYPGGELERELTEEAWRGWEYDEEIGGLPDETAMLLRGLGIHPEEVKEVMQREGLYFES